MRRERERRELRCDDWKVNTALEGETLGKKIRGKEKAGLRTSSEANEWLTVVMKTLVDRQSKKMRYDSPSLYHNKRPANSTISIHPLPLHPRRPAIE
jgi:hypothetical protein